jgi:hypothetical protein
MRFHPVMSIDEVLEKALEPAPLRGEAGGEAPWAETGVA